MTQLSVRLQQRDVSLAADARARSLRRSHDCLAQLQQLAGRVRGLTTMITHPSAPPLSRLSPSSRHRFLQEIDAIRQELHRLHVAELPLDASSTGYDSSTRESYASGGEVGLDCASDCHSELAHAVSRNVVPLASSRHRTTSGPTALSASTRAPLTSSGKQSHSLQLHADRDVYTADDVVRVAVQSCRGVVADLARRIVAVPGLFPPVSPGDAADFVDDEDAEAELLAEIEHLNKLTEPLWHSRGAY